jgi:FKBP-type peptidyl-prolyl cis-trans isomerase FklB
MSDGTRRMRRRWSGIAVAACLAGCAPEPAPLPTTADERMSYAVGLHLGMRLREMAADLDADRIVAGFRAGADEQRPTGPMAALDAEQVRLEVAQLAAEQAEVARAARAALAQRNQRTGDAFLAENRARADVVELSSDVQYRLVSGGDGEPPTLHDRITVEYQGRLLDGSVFDSSHDRFAPTIVRLSRTHPAWREVLPRVGTGAMVEIWSPGRLVDAADGIGLVPPGEVVTFTVRLVAIDRHPQTAAARAAP